MSIGTLLCTWLSGKLIGTDQFGNRYYTERAEPKGRRRKRWVIYKGEVEASRIPAEWHAWLHYTTSQPLERNEAEKPWLKQHEPNKTGTDQAYLPPGHDLRGGKRATAPGDYQAWRP